MIHLEMHVVIDALTVSMIFAVGFRMRSGKKKKW